MKLSKLLFWKKEKPTPEPTLIYQIRLIGGWKNITKEEFDNFNGLKRVLTIEHTGRVGVDEVAI